jgi:ferrous iron transport protein A
MRGNTSTSKRLKNTDEELSLEVTSSIGHSCFVITENDNRFHSVIVEERPDPLPAAMSRRLSVVPLNRWFRIEKLDGPREDCNRLIDLGFTPGEDVLVTHTAPLGDPLVIQVRGALLALRKREAAWIWVQ